MPANSPTLAGKNLADQVESQVGLNPSNWPVSHPCQLQMHIAKGHPSIMNRSGLCISPEQLQMILLQLHTSSHPVDYRSRATHRA